MLRRTAPPRRTSSLRRWQPLAKQSAAGKSRAAAQKRAYRAAPDAGQRWCTICGRVGKVETSHYYTQKLHPEHRNNYLNWCKKCPSCHSQWEHDKAGFAAAWPEAWATILGQMQALDPRAFARWRQKYPY